jgi:hypothetical protein
MSEAKKSSPASKVSIWPVTGTIWRNEGSKGAFYSATYERSYKDAEGKYKSSDSFSGIDSLVLAKVADLVFMEINKLRASDKSAATEE